MRATDRAAGWTDGSQAELALSPRDENITLQVFIDNTVLEAYWQGGWVTLTLQVVPTDEVAMALTASEEATLCATAWQSGALGIHCMSMYGCRRSRSCAKLKAREKIKNRPSMCTWITLYTSTVLVHNRLKSKKTLTLLSSVSPLALGGASGPAGVPPPAPHA